MNHDCSFLPGYNNAKSVKKEDSLCISDKITPKNFVDR